MKNEWRFKYGVKFYLSDPSMLKEDISRLAYSNYKDKKIIPNITECF